MREFVVNEAPQAPRRLFAADGLAKALDCVAAHVGPPTTRLMAWWPEEPFTGAAEPLVAVPLRVYRAVEALAEGVVDEWDRAWLLIDSTTASRREEAWDDLVGAVAAVLLSAAVTGVAEAEPDATQRREVDHARLAPPDERRATSPPCRRPTGRDYEGKGSFRSARRPRPPSRAGAGGSTSSSSTTSGSKSPPVRGDGSG